MKFYNYLSPNNLYQLNVQPCHVNHLNNLKNTVTLFWYLIIFFFSFLLSGNHDDFTLDFCFHYAKNDVISRPRSTKGIYIFVAFFFSFDFLI